MKGKSNGMLILAVLAILFFAGVLTFKGAPGTTQSVDNPKTGGAAQSTGSIGYASTVSAAGMDTVTAALANINVEVIKQDGTNQVGETQANAALTSISTAMPNSFDGFWLVGNDNFVSGTDRGTEYYYHKAPLKYSASGSVTDAAIPVYQEGTLTITGYDDGTAESNISIVVGTANVDTTEFRFQVSADSAYGNPDFAKPVGVCFNASRAADFDAIKPINSAGTFEPPRWLNGTIGKCHVLDTAALIDNSRGVSKLDYRFFVRIDPAGGVNPNYASEGLCLVPMDLTYFKKDSVLTSGFWDDGGTGTGDDVGSAAACTRWFIT